MRFIALSLCCLALWSCAGGDDAHKAARPKTVIAKGGIRFQGKPLDNAIIVIAPTTEKGTAASAVSDGTGRFELIAFPPESGAVPGTYGVAVLKTPPSADVPYSETGHDAPMLKKPAKQAMSIPEKYMNAETSGLVLIIPQEGSETLVLDLKD